MANTKNLSREERKKAKRVARKELRSLALQLTRKDRRAIRKADEPIGVRAYLAEKAKPKSED